MDKLSASVKTAGGVVPKVMTKETALMVGVGATAVVAAPLVLSAAGFGAAGVAAGSVAAWIQAIEDRQRSTQNILEEEKKKREYISDQIVALNETITLYAGERAKKERMACRDGWLAYNGSCYYFGRDNTHFESAKALCAQLDSYLVQVETETENNFVRHFLKSFISQDDNINFWLGITDSQEEGIWRWNSDGLPATFKGWVGTEPQDYGSGEDCAMLYSRLDFGWADLSCTSSQRPLCEEKP